ncbi:MAG: hypothetical protein J4F43_06355 [Dehalococcoidia bacterium]|nr:hypothetical protein [Dehalococcoidia bacterium]
MANRRTREDARSRLGERAARIVRLRDDGLLLWEIAERVGVTKERVRQILAKARAAGAGPRPPGQVVTRQASILLGLSAEMRPGSFQRLMTKFGIEPVANKRGRLYWKVSSLRGIKAPKCQVCGSPIPLSRYSRSVTCSRGCSTARRHSQSSRKKAAAGDA